MIVKKLISVGVAAITALSFGATAHAKADLVFMHNASPYFVWSDLEACQYDHKDANLGCDSFIHTYHDCRQRNLFATSATGRIAKSRLDSHQKVLLFQNDGRNTKFCTIKP